MNDGLYKLTSHRKWVVPDFVVWGVPGLGDIDYLNIEEVDGTSSVAFGTESIGGTDQSVVFGSLVDIRGNYLPQSIVRPFVTFRSQSPSQVFLIGTESSGGFKLARDPSAVGPVTVDLIIIELGE